MPTALWSSALFAVLFYAISLSVGDVISAKTKGFFSSVLVVSAIYIVGYLTNLIPTDTLANTGLLVIVNNFAMSLIVTNLGTMININQLLSEWRTILICLFGLACLGVACILFGTPIYGKEYALAAFPPIAGGFPATIMVENAATAASHPDIGAFAWLILPLQLFVGIPIATIILRNYCQHIVKTDTFKNYQIGSSSIKTNINLRFIPALPQKYNTPNVVLMKLLLITYLSTLVSGLTGIPAAIFCLIFGVLFTEIGFLDRNSLQGSGMMNFIMFCMIAAAPNSFVSLTPESLGGMLVMTAFFLIIGAIALGIGGALFGKLFRVDPRMGATMSLNAMFGFPFNLMITDDIIRGLQLSENDSAKLREMVLPKMVVAGFTSVTIASVVIAGIVIPLIF